MTEPYVRTRKNALIFYRCGCGLLTRTPTCGCGYVNEALPPSQFAERAVAVLVGLALVAALAWAVVG